LTGTAHAGLPHHDFLAGKLPEPLADARRSAYAVLEDAVRLAEGPHDEHDEKDHDAGEREEKEPRGRTLAARAALAVAMNGSLGPT
jgi:hypothetical protein